MKILLYGLNFKPELSGIGKYSGEMADWLVQHGHELRVVTAPPYYPAWRIGQGYSAWRYQREQAGRMMIDRCPLYVPNTPTTLKRLVHLLSFAASSIVALMRQLRWRPDVVVVVIPTLFCVPMISGFARLYRAKTWLHIQDFELDAMLGLGMLGPVGRLARWAQRLETFFLRRFNRVSTISTAMHERLLSKGVAAEQALIFPNWVDAELITPTAHGQYYRDLWGLTHTDKVVLYSGNLGEKQGLEILLTAAQQLADDTRIKFIIVGEGAAKARLQSKAQQLELENVQFHPLQPYERLPDLLCMADIHLVLQRRGAADAVLPSKLTGIFAAGGTALITADQETELGRLVAEHPGIAELVEPENSAHLMAVLRKQLEAVDHRSRTHNRIARRYAEQQLHYERVLGRFEQQLLTLHNG